MKYFRYLGYCACSSTSWSYAKADLTSLDRSESHNACIIERKLCETVRVYFVSAVITRYNMTYVWYNDPQGMQKYLRMNNHTHICPD